MLPEATQELGDIVAADLFRKACMRLLAFSIGGLVERKCADLFLGLLRP
jgi:hypothetical protein